MGKGREGKIFKIQVLFRLRDFGEGGEGEGRKWSGFLLLTGFFFGGNGDELIGKEGDGWGVLNVYVKQGYIDTPYPFSIEKHPLFAK